MLNLVAIVRLSLFSSSGLALLLLFSLIYSSPLHNSHLELVVHRQLDTIPDGYIQAGEANSSQIINLIIGLHPPNITGLTKRLYQVSMPNSTKYGQYLTKEEVEEHVRPNPNTTKVLEQWLTSNGLAPEPETSSSTGSHVNVKLTVEQAGKLLNTTFHLYNHTSSNQSIIRTDQYSVPELIKDAIRMVHPTTFFSPKPIANSPQHPATSSLAAINSNTVNLNRRDNQCGDFRQISANCIPATVMELYGIPSDLGAPATEDRTAIIALNGNAVQAVDLAKYMKQFRPDIPLSEIQLDVLSVDQGDNSIQSSLDNAQINANAQLVIGVMPSTKTTIIASGQTDPQFGSNFLDVINFILGLENMPKVTTVANGVEESMISVELAQTTCEAIQQYVTRGGTFIAVAGDAAVSSAQPPSCTTFQPFFPGTCPWALAVGATNWSSSTEIAAAVASGGFSNIFPVQDHQANAVTGYLDQIGGLYAGLYNKAGRGFPDIAIVGLNLLVQNQGGFELGSGAPFGLSIVAAMVSGLNQQRANEGKPSLGFLNPLLYENKDKMNDITQGSGFNPECNFPVKSGWDPITGLGSFHFDKMASILV
ncbi:hypothetical protein Clacol_006124 [Clathrus columnatus]|uniref:Peptidase S53 domain-containing protein n=1 Tax=Clathrus columnatus TaxID=1419009 RepID=A0AAV5AHC3_9AGAM|nr:hypothetical protein Clacol_006124 [Clathrus columnatus]